MSTLIRTLSLLLALALAPAAIAQLSTAPAPPDAPAPSDLEYVKMETSSGVIVLELNRAKAPHSVQNFLRYADRKFYDGTIFHRVIPRFMIQGGGFTETLEQKRTDLPIRNEASNGLSNKRGTIAMARTADPNSATSQFYINHKDNPNLDAYPGSAGYAVFGKVIVGMPVVDLIATVATHNAATPAGQTLQNVPMEPVQIRTVRHISKADADALVAEAEAARKKAEEGADDGKGATTRPDGG
ncbi:MAG: peptidylprolyl isomerase [Phycisphaerales bacterium]|nr:peptidylprolyl isomerase [Phycisphaerales bacterium]